LIAAVLCERLARPLSPADLGFVADRQRPVVGRALVFGEDVADTLHTLAELGCTDISRRTLLGTVPFVAGALTNPQREWLLWLLEREGTTDGAGGSGRAGGVRAIAAAVPPPGCAGPVEQVHAMIGMFDEMDNQYGGGGVRTSIVHYLATEIVPMLQQRGVAPDRLRELFAAAARLAAMAGWSSYDAGEYGLAQRYMTQGLRLCANPARRARRNGSRRHCRHPARPNVCARTCNRRGARADRYPSSFLSAGLPEGVYGMGNQIQAAAVQGAERMDPRERR
jgi:hypothetical protein